jgi:hypothetical protein
MAGAGSVTLEGRDVVADEGMDAGIGTKASDPPIFTKRSLPVLMKLS